MDWGTAISVGSNLIDGLMGGGVSAKKQLGMLRGQYAEAQRNARQMPSDIVTGMRNAGLHPLVGFSGGFQPSMATGSIGGEDSRGSQIADGISRAANVYAGRAEREIGAKAAELSLENQELQNEMLRTQILHMKAPGTPPGFSGTKIDGQGDSHLAVAKAAIEAMDTPFGRTQGSFPLHKTAYDEDGDAVRFYNEESLGDNDIAQIAHFLRYTMPDYFHNFGRKVGRKIGSKFRDRKSVRGRNPYRM